jgi:hypothetical protein
MADSGHSPQAHLYLAAGLVADEVGGTCSTGIECAKVQLL